MVHIGNGESATRHLNELLRELQEHRKIQHRTFTRHSDGDAYTVLMFAHDQEGALVVVFTNCAMPQLKETMLMDTFLEQFEQQTEATQPIVPRRQV